MRSSAPSRSSSCTTCAEPYTLVVFGYAASKLATASSIVFGSVQNSTACSRRNCWPGMPASSFSMRSAADSGTTGGTTLLSASGDGRQVIRLGIVPLAVVQAQVGQGIEIVIDHEYIDIAHIYQSFQAHLSDKVSEGSRGARHWRDREGEAYFGTRVLGLAARSGARELRSVEQFRRPTNRRNFPRTCTSPSVRRASRAAYRTSMRACSGSRLDAS